MLILRKPLQDLDEVKTVINFSIHFKLYVLPPAILLNQCTIIKKAKFEKRFHLSAPLICLKDNP